MPEPKRYRIPSLLVHPKSEHPRGPIVRHHTNLLPPARLSISDGPPFQAPVSIATILCIWIGTHSWPIVRHHAILAFSCRLSISSDGPPFQAPVSTVIILSRWIGTHSGPEARHHAKLKIYLIMSIKTIANKNDFIPRLQK
jgi:hypothetical protein